jgi:hypothetical protein
MNFAKRAQIIALAEDVAEALPGNWDVKPFPDDWGRIGAWLTDPDTKAQLAIGESQARSKDARTDRLDVSTDYPKDSQGTSAYEARPKISVSASKTGAQIAHDIERRLFPEYLPLLEKVLARYQAADNFEQRTTSIAQKIARLVHVKAEPKSQTVSFYKSPYLLFKETMSEAKVLDDSEVELTLRLDTATALKVLNQLVHGRFEDPDPRSLVDLSVYDE